MIGVKPLKLIQIVDVQQRVNWTDFCEEVGTVSSPHHRSNCSSCDSRRSAEWACLSDPGLASLDRIKKPRIFSAGEIIYRQGDDNDGVHCLQDGLVGIRRLDEQGNSTLLRLVDPGETIGYKSFLRKLPHGNTAETLMPSRVCFIDRGNLRGLLRHTPELGLKFLDHSLRDLAAAEQRYMESVTSKARTRLLHLLLVLYERFGFRTEQGAYQIELPITRQDLAGLIGTAPETMSRTIHRLQTEGLAAFDGRTVRLTSIDAILDDIPAAW